MNYTDPTRTVDGQTSPYVQGQTPSESGHQQQSSMNNMGLDNPNGTGDYSNSQYQEYNSESLQNLSQGQPDTQQRSITGLAGGGGGLLSGYQNHHNSSTAVGVVRGAARLHHQVQIPPNTNAMSPRLPTIASQHQYGFQNTKGNYREYAYGGGNSSHSGGMENHLKLSDNNVGHQSTLSAVMPHAINSQAASTNHNIISNNNDSNIVPHAMNSSLASGLLSLSGFGSSSSVSTATAVANIASLINPSTSSNSLAYINQPSSSSLQSPSLPSSAIVGHQRPAYMAGRTFTTTMDNGQVNSSHNGFTPPNPQETTIKHNIHGDTVGMASSNYQKQNGRNLLNSGPDQTLRLQRELEQERNWRTQLQQRVVELSQKIQSQHLVEKSYEDLVQKYKMLLVQMQQMSVVIERYKAYLKQLEQEKRMLYSDNASMKAQENVAHDKTMLYNILMERSRKLEKENSSLVLENETYQRQYEKCIDEISKQVVQALLTQKALQEQCLQLQDRLGDLERENSDYYEAAVRQARQASSDSRLGWSYKGNKARTHAASPSADSVRSMPAQHHYWRQNSVSSLDHPPPQQQPHLNTEPSVNGRRAEDTDNSQSPWTEIDRKTAAQGASAAPPIQSISIETEFPANNGSPKSTRRSLEKHPSSGSLDSAYHSRGFVKYNGQDVRYQRSVSAEALRDLKVNMRPKNDLTLRVVPKSNTAPVILASSEPAAASPHIIHHKAEVHTDLSPGSTIGGHMTDSGVVNDPFADDADDILSKHQSLIVGSMEDIFNGVGSNVRDFVIQEEESGSNSGRSTQEKQRHKTQPNPPARPWSRSYSDCSYSNDQSRSPPLATDNGPPPLPPKQYKGSRRPYKPLPAEPPESQYEADDDSSDKNTDSESIKQEINALTSQISRMASAR